MENYAKSNNDLVSLFKESLELANEDIENYLELHSTDIEDVVFTIFHGYARVSFEFLISPLPHGVGKCKSDDRG